MSDTSGRQGETIKERLLRALLSVVGEEGRAFLTTMVEMVDGRGRISDDAAWGWRETGAEALPTLRTLITLQLVEPGEAPFAWCFTFKAFRMAYGPGAGRDEKAWVRPQLAADRAEAEAQVPVTTDGDLLLAEEEVVDRLYGPSAK